MGTAKSSNTTGDISFNREILWEDEFVAPGWGIINDLPGTHRLERITEPSGIKVSGKIGLGLEFSSVTSNGRRETEITFDILGQDLKLDLDTAGRLEWPLRVEFNPPEIVVGGSVLGRGYEYSLSVEYGDGNFMFSEHLWLNDEIYTAEVGGELNLGLLKLNSAGSPPSNGTSDPIGDAAAELQAEFPHLTDSRARQIVEDAASKHESMTPFTHLMVSPHESVELHVDRSALAAGQRVSDRHSSHERRAEGPADAPINIPNTVDPGLAAAAAAAELAAQQSAARREQREDQDREDRFEAQRLRRDEERAENTQQDNTAPSEGQSWSDGTRTHVQASDTRRGHGQQAPIILDLNGDGIQLTELSNSTIFMDATGDGQWRAHVRPA
ncbi:MAG: hypothetical protein V3U96_01165 [Paracoccaceae bacterium]